MSSPNESASEPANEPATVVLTDVKPSTSDKAMADAVDAALSPSSTTDQRVHSASNVRPDPPSTWRNSLSFISDVYLCEFSNLRSHTVDLQPYLQLTYSGLSSPLSSPPSSTSPCGNWVSPDTSLHCFQSSPQRSCRSPRRTATSSRQPTQLHHG